MSRRPNYLAPVSILVDQLRRKDGRGRITHVAVEHEDGCAFWTGGPCDCEPDVQVLRSERVSQEGDDDA